MMKRNNSKYTKIKRKVPEGKFYKTISSATNYNYLNKTISIK